MLSRVLPFSHQLLEKSVTLGDIVVDCTAGNGHDTVFLANLVGAKGQVLSFDIQKEAIETTKEYIKKEGLNQVTLIHDSHSEMEKYLTELMIRNIGGAIFNLGYLPGSDHSITTKPDTTIKAVQVLLEHLQKGKLIVLVVYYGHEGGTNEKEQLVNFVKNLDQKKYQVLQYAFINQKNNPPFLLAIEKR